MTKSAVFIVASLLFGFLNCRSDMPKDKNNIIAESPSPEELQYIQDSINAAKARKEADAAKAAWVEEKFQSLTEDEKLGQLFMLAAYPSKGLVDQQNVEKLIEKYKIGGIIFFKGNPTYTAQLTNLYQSKSPKVPLLMGLDGEWSVSMRMDSTVRYPRQMTLGAVRDNKLIYAFGKRVAYECKRIGIHINFAPVIDVNNNPENPVIGDRSFGDNLSNVVEKGSAYMRGMQDHGVLASAKHFPGHGDTNTDSHHDLPIINHSKERLDSIELYPFKELIKRGVASIMVGHLNVPALDSTENLPSSLSPKIVKDLLKDKMGFEGLAITDAMNMAGITKHHKNGESDLLALIAGNDILLMTQDMGAAIPKIKKAIEEGKLTWEDIDLRVKCILAAKYMAGLHAYQPVDLANITKDLGEAEAELLKEELLAKSLTLVSNEEKVFPLASENYSKVATIMIGSTAANTFQSQLKANGITKNNHIASTFAGALTDRFPNIKEAETVIIALSNVGKLPKDNFKLLKNQIDFINDLAKTKKVVLVVFGNPYCLVNFPELKNVVVAYDNTNQIQNLTAQAIIGHLPFEGMLPVTVTPNYIYGKGEITKSSALPYSTQPESVGLKSTILNQIDAVAKDLIAKQAAPGCQIMVVRHGKIAYNKAFGYHTYDKQQANTTNDIYDLASVTKIAATTIALMNLYEEGKIELDKTLGHYLPELKGTNKANLRIKDVLTHSAGLVAWIPFYKETLDSAKLPSPDFYKTEQEGDFNIKVAENLYTSQKVLDEMLWKKIYESELSPSNYRYSDLGLIIFSKLVEKITNKTLDEYVYETFYRPMGLENITFNPLDNDIDKSRIVPSENDNYFRHQILQGYVHDMGAAMLGGVSGHAGLFASAENLAAIMQMLLNEGEFKGRAYLQPSTVKLFTAKQSEKSRRGLGFDKKDASTTKPNVALQASAQTFGHTGFTGIGAWADPKEDLVFLFLSNRTFPSMNNNKLISMNYRVKIQEIVYKAIIK